MRCGEPRNLTYISLSIVVVSVVIVSYKVIRHNMPHGHLFLGHFFFKYINHTVKTVRHVTVLLLSHLILRTSLRRFVLFVFSFSKMKGTFPGSNPGPSFATRDAAFWPRGPVTPCKVGGFSSIAFWKWKESWFLNLLVI